MASGHQGANFEMFYWWILEEHAILPNFHVLTISVAAMDQKLFLILVSEILGTFFI